MVSSLGGSDDQVVDFITAGLTEAAGQDDRLVLADLSEAGTDGFKAAAANALAGSDTVVRDFLRSRDYPGRMTDDSLQVNQIMAAARAAGRTVVVQQAQRALDQNTDQALRAFLDTGQYTALNTDEDVKVNQVMAAARSAGAREVVAAAQAAIDGPPTLRHEFLTVGQFAAARRDQNTAAHNAAIEGLLAQAAAAAATATHDANDAQAAAARARNAAEEAQSYADQAGVAAAQATTCANKARAAANRAAESAQQAQASANTATAAAKSAAVSADKASASAAWAQRSADAAAGYASDAAISAGIAYGAALDAGKSAQEAARLAKEAWQGVADKAKLEKQNAINQRTWDCNNRAAWVTQSLNTEDCIKLFSGTSAEQQRILSHLQEQCRQLNDPGTVELANCLDSRNLLNADFMPGPAPYGESEVGQSVTGLVLAGLLALMCPECDLAAFLGNAESELGLTGARELSAMMAEALARGDGLFNAAAAEASAELGKVSEMAIQADLQHAELSRVAREYQNRFPLCAGNSFVAGTRVLMADGRAKPIEDIAVGDHVAGADPGSTPGSHLVEAVHVTDDDHDFTTVTVGTSGGTQSIESTAKHLYWNATAHEWTEAAGLQPGQSLETAGGGRATVVADHRHPGAARTYNLSVNAVHTYYVLAGDVSALVHNANSPGCEPYFRVYGPEQKSGIIAEVNDGVLTMIIEGDAYSPRGGHMFADVMSHFGAENVRRFDAKWVTKMPTNLDAFNANLRKGMSFEDAAVNTFTGYMCAKYGLTKVTVDRSKLVGSFGAYTDVAPTFSRP
jgi:hypothetical protein